MVDTSNQLVPEMAIDYCYAPTGHVTANAIPVFFRGGDFSDFSAKALRSKAAMFKA